MEKETELAISKLKKYFKNAIITEDSILPDFIIYAIHEIHDKNNKRCRDLFIRIMETPNVIEALKNTYEIRDKNYIHFQPNTALRSGFSYYLDYINRITNEFNLIMEDY